MKILWQKITDQFKWRSPSDLDVILPLKNDPNYTQFLPLCLRGIAENVHHRIGTVYIVSKTEVIVEGKYPFKIKWVSEVAINNKIQKFYQMDWKSVEPLSHSWIAQQVYKMHCFLISRAEHVLVVDADLFFVQPTRFWDEKNRYIFYMENEYYIPYFNTIRRLLGVEKVVEDSFISDQMLFHAETLREMLQYIEGRCSKTFIEALSEALLNEKDSRRALSEYELYGTYLAHFYPEKIAKLVPNPNPGLLHFHLPDPRPWTYEELKKQLNWNHYFVPMAPTERLPENTPPLTGASCIR